MRPDNELLYGLQVQGEMDTAGGQLELTGRAVVMGPTDEVGEVVGRLLVVF